VASDRGVVDGTAGWPDAATCGEATWGDSPGEFDLELMKLREAAEAAKTPAEREEDARVREAKRREDLAKAAESFGASAEPGGPWRTATEWRALAEASWERAHEHYVESFKSRRLEHVRPRRPMPFRRLPRARPRARGSRRARSPGRRSDGDEPPHDVTAVWRGFQAASARLFAHERRRLGARRVAA